MLAALFIESLQSNPRFFFAVLITVVVSICLHELAHGLAAVRLGDRTPIERDRMTLNPLVHMGLFSFIMLLLAGIAWGAMPITPGRLRGRYAEAAVAVAGPATNVLLAALALTALGLWQRFEPPGERGQLAENGIYLLWVFGLTNIALAMFNLLPVPPLDGARILANFSSPFRRLTDTAAGGLLVVFLLVFAYVGPMIFRAAGYVARNYLVLVRGWET